MPSEIPELKQVERVVYRINQIAIERAGTSLVHLNSDGEVVWVKICRGLWDNSDVWTGSRKARVRDEELFACVIGELRDLMTEIRETLEVCEKGVDKPRQDDKVEG